MTKFLSMFGCLRYLCLFTHSGVQHLLWFVFALYFLVLCTLCCQFLWIVYFLLPLRCSATFIDIPMGTKCAPLIINRYLYCYEADFIP
jgi:hypothetical protein